MIDLVIDSTHAYCDGQAELERAEAFIRSEMNDSKQAQKKMLKRLGLSLDDYASFYDGDPEALASDYAEKLIKLKGKCHD